MKHKSLKKCKSDTTLFRSHKIYNPCVSTEMANMIYNQLF